MLQGSVFGSPKYLKPITLCASQTISASAADDMQLYMWFNKEITINSVCVAPATSMHAQKVVYFIIEASLHMFR